MSWLGFDPTPYSADDWHDHAMDIKSVDMKWIPKGVVLHATGLPTLGQWAEMGPAHDARLNNLERYYQGMGWQHGPHAFISRHYINGFSDLRQRGTHCSCHNFTHFGIEQAGNFNTGHDDYNHGDGALVKANAVWAIACLMKRFDLKPETLIPHSECRADGHFQCPGNEVDMDEMRRLVASAMGAFL